MKNSINHTKSSLAIQLSKIVPFSKPKLNLEQYITPSEIAAEILWIAYMQGDISQKVIADLGSGTGILGIGAVLLDAKKVIFYDKDKDAIKDLIQNLEIYSVKVRVQGELSKENEEKVQVINSKIEVINADIEEIDIIKDKKLDTIIMNPPFGSQIRHADQKFILNAFKVANVIYSIHTSKSESFLQKIAKDNDFLMQKIFEKKFMIKSTYKHHKKKLQYIDVIIVRFQKIPNKIDIKNALKK